MKFIIVMMATLMIVIEPRICLADDDEDFDHAVQETQKALKDSEKRQDLLRNNKKGKEVDAYVNNLSGSKEITDEIYGLSADILPIIAAKANGDPNKMMKLLEEAQKNPEAFAKDLSPEQKKKLSEIAAKVEKQKFSKP